VKKRFSLLTILLAVLILHGCTSVGDGVIPPANKTGAPQVKTIIHYYDSSDSTQIASAAVKAFNAQSTATEVVLHFIDNEIYDDEIIRLIHEGNTPIDCCYLRQPCQVNQYYGEGLLMDLTDAVKRSGLNPASYGQTLDIISIANTIPALPRTKSVWLLFYNRDIFERLGLKEPSNLTWEEYASLTKRLTATNEDGSVIYGGYIPPWTLNIGAVAAGEYLYDDELPYTRRYIELLNKLYNVDQSHPDIAQMEGEYNLPNLVFLKQQIATMVNGDWVVYLLNNAFADQSSAFRWGIATLPVFPDVPKGTSIGNCSYLAVLESSAHKENAFEFISYFCGDSAADMVADLATCPAYYTEQSAERYQKNAGVPGAQLVFDSFVRNEEGTFIRYRELNSTFKSCLMDYLRGAIPLDEAFARFEEQRIPILKGK
jgi:ABC-type glycerol-3-phosphate transport system substrate-binding protein